jgi:hypothetical protein
LRAAFRALLRIEVRTIFWPNESSVNFSGASFCDNQDDFSQLSRFCWSVYRVSHTEGIIELRGETGWNKLKSLSAIILGASVSKIGSTGAAGMAIRQTPNSAEEQKRGLRLLAGSTKVLIAQDPDRLITLRDGSGRVLAQHDPAVGS